MDTLAKIRESMITSFHYVPPKDPELLLYDFYFLVGYIYGETFDDDVQQFAMSEAVTDCLTNLRLHMLKALKFSLAAELQHITDCTSEFETVRRAARGGDLAAAQAAISKVLLPKLGEQGVAFITAYLKQHAILEDSTLMALLGQTGRSKRDFSGILRNEGESGYGESYAAMCAAQKEMGLSDYDVSEILETVYSKFSWSRMYGGTAWGSIATAWKKLLTANDITHQIVYIDHAYDLQHNTDTVFNKIDAYSKSGGYSWLANALDWKRDNTDIREFYEKVSSTLKPLVGYQAWRKYHITMEQLEDDRAAKAAAKRAAAKKTSPKKGASKGGSTKKNIIGNDDKGYQQDANFLLSKHWYVWADSTVAAPKNWQTSITNVLLDGFPHQVLIADGSDSTAKWDFNDNWKTCPNALKYLTDLGTELSPEWREKIQAKYAAQKANNEARLANKGPDFFTAFIPGHWYAVKTGGDQDIVHRTLTSWPSIPENMFKGSITSGLPFKCVSVNMRDPTSHIGSTQMGAKKVSIPLYYEAEFEGIPNGTWELDDAPLALKDLGDTLPPEYQAKVDEFNKGLSQGDYYPYFIPGHYYIWDIDKESYPKVKHLTYDWYDTARKGWRQERKPHLCTGADTGRLLSTTSAVVKGFYKAKFQGISGGFNDYENAPKFLRDLGPTITPEIQAWIDAKVAEDAAAAAAAAQAPKGSVVTAENYTKGKKVVRGPNWKWGNQDGGRGHQGTLDEDRARSDKWGSVKWDNRDTNIYRVGAIDGNNEAPAYDLQYVE